MDHKKQLKEIRNAISEAKKILPVIQNRSEFSFNIEDCRKTLILKCDQAALLIATAYESHKLSEMAVIALKDLSELSLVEVDPEANEAGQMWSPKIERLETYYNALVIVGTSTRYDKFKEVLKVAGAIASILSTLGVFALLKGCSPDQQQEVPATTEITTGTSS